MMSSTQNWKYLMYHKTAKGGRSHGHR